MFFTLNSSLFYTKNCPRAETRGQLFIFVGDFTQLPADARRTGAGCVADHSAMIVQSLFVKPTGSSMGIPSISSA